AAWLEQRDVALDFIGDRNQVEVHRGYGDFFDGHGLALAVELDAVVFASNVDIYLGRCIDASVRGVLDQGVQLDVMQPDIQLGFDGLADLDRTCDVDLRLTQRKLRDRIEAWQLTGNLHLRADGLPDWPGRD